MKKVKIAKKLELTKETLRPLDSRNLIQAAGGSGGGWSDNSVCPTTTPSRACP